MAFPTPSSALAASLKGQRVQVSCLYDMFVGWSFGINPNYERMVEVVDEKLKHMVGSSTVRQKFRQADFALFTGVMYPRAEWLEYLTLTTLVLFFFLWDDEIEDGQCSEFSAGQQSRKHTIEFVKHCLGFGTGNRPVAPNLVVDSFQEVGDTLCKAYTASQRKVLLSELLFSAKASQLEQQLRLQHAIPKIEEYRVIRNGTIAVGPYLALGEFSNRLSLPEELVQSPLMKILWREACVIISIINDIVSVAKELSQDVPSVLSQIPLACAEVSLDVADVKGQDGVDITMASLCASIQIFEKAASSLLWNSTGQVHNDLKLYINTVQENITGTLYWSMTSSRYGMAEAVQEDGSLFFLL